MSGTLSISRLKSFTYCGEKYRLEKIVGASSPPGAWTILGTAFHTTYERWERSDREGGLADNFGEEYAKATENELRYHPIETWEKRPRIASVQRDLELYLATGMQQCIDYESHCRAADWKIAEVNGELGLELMSSVEIGTTTVRFAVDQVLRWPDGRLTVRDLKTGKIAEDNRQIGFYKLFLKMAYGVNIDYGEYWYTKLNKSGGWVDLKRYTYEYAVDQFEALASAHTYGVFIANPGKQCDLCAVKKDCREMGWSTT